ncbi:MAG TPA: hypothetical protein PLI09_01830 [Candidatus Hydrogenedentes bacterium]|nr:hypothetical protein [Candidatus Hydrogenedentota bacterium]
MEPNTPEIHLPVAAGKKNWIAACVLSAILLLCGMVLGGVITFKYMSSRIMEEGPRQERTPERIVEKLRGELGLDDTQAAAILEVFTRGHETLEAIRLKVDPEVEQEMETIRVEVEQYLNSGQKEKWNKRVQEMRERHRPRAGHLKHGGGPVEHGMREEGQ